jgi:hypothetical protein
MMHDTMRWNPCFSQDETRCAQSLSESERAHPLEVLHGIDDGAGKREVNRHVEGLHH